MGGSRDAPDDLVDGRDHLRKEMNWYGSYWQEHTGCQEHTGSGGGSFRAAGGAHVLELGDLIDDVEDVNALLGSLRRAAEPQKKRTFHMLQKPAIPFVPDGSLPVAADSCYGLP